MSKIQQKVIQMLLFSQNHANFRSQTKTIVTSILKICFRNVAKLSKFVKKQINKEQITERKASSVASLTQRLSTKGQLGWKSHSFSYLDGQRLRRISILLQFVKYDLFAIFQRELNHFTNLAASRRAKCYSHVLAVLARQLPRQIAMQFLRR